MAETLMHLQAMNVSDLSAIASLLGTTVKWAPVAEQCLDDPLAESFHARERRNEYDILSV